VRVSTTIRVSEPTRDRFARLAQATGRPMSQLLDEAADALERRVFFDELSARYEVLRADPDAWSEIEAERTAESGSLRDRAS
jgi:predicted transcriptional regulator